MDWKVQEYTDNIANLETELQEPQEYKVIFLNDDYTTMDFVVAMLVTVFHKTELFHGWIITEQCQMSCT